MALLVQIGQFVDCDTVLGMFVVGISWILGLLSLACDRWD